MASIRTCLPVSVRISCTKNLIILCFLVRIYTEATRSAVKKTYRFTIEKRGQLLKMVVSSYKESRNNKPIYGYMLPYLSPSPNLYKVQSVYNNNVAS